MGARRGEEEKLGDLGRYKGGENMHTRDRFTENSKDNVNLSALLRSGMLCRATYVIHGDLHN
jgi:hypothetical protein